MLITFRDYSTGDTNVWTETDGLTVSYNGSYPFKSRTAGPIQPGFPFPWFEIDSVNNRIINLTLSNGSIHFVQYSTNSDGGADIHLKFDPIPFTRDGDKIVVPPGRYASHLKFDAFRGYGMHQWSYGGGCSDSGFVLDSVSLEITPFHAGVDVVNKSANGLSVFLSSNSVLFCFRESPIERILEVCNATGMQAMTESIGEDQTTYVLPNLPPGCYFARLGHEVAKFVVMP